jgi:hypothetical protein
VRHPTLARVLVPFALLTCVGLPGKSSATAQGSRPRNLAISSDGTIVLSTSWGSQSISQLRRGAGGALGNLQHIDLGSPSWDVVILDALDGQGNPQVYAIVTHPSADYISVIVAGTDAAGATFTAHTPIAFSGLPTHATAMTPSPNPGCVLIAYRGASATNPAAPIDANSWMHVVREFDFIQGMFTGKEFATEREPSSLCMSPDGAILFVGHIQGALGQPSPYPSVYFAGSPQVIFDGGSILAFDFDSPTAATRYPIGSPIRDVAIFPPLGTPAAHYPHGMDPPFEGDSGDYVLYFTHVGDGSASEHPLAGGKEIRNVISSIRFDSSNSPSAPDGDPRKDVIFGHESDTFTPAQYEYAETSVIPEQLAFRYDGEDWSLWSTFSGSGNVGMAPIGSDGRLTVNETDYVDTLDLWVVTGRDSEGFILRDPGSDTTGNLRKVDPSSMTLSYGVVQGGLLVDVGEQTTGYRIQSSNPRGIVVDPSADRILLVNQFEGNLAEIDPVAATPVLVHHCLLGTGCPPESDRGVGEAERNFFTFGRGFDFREPSTNATSLFQTDDRVDNLACSTCHVNGHLDGKVRLSALAKVNSNLSTPLHPGVVPVNQGDNRTRKFKAIAVPSIFESGSSEWLFFEGLQTTFDALGQNDPMSECLYCSFNFAGIFLNTRDFAMHAQSERSPYHVAGLTAQQARGRDVFEELNCSRCHAGPLASNFDRVSPDAGQIPSGLTHGPIFDFLEVPPPLSDPTQVFVQGGGALALSARNMSVVGTRPDDEGREVNGVNTPALAGAWNNAPYFHDGRYRTLLEVLEHTWLDPSNGLSAPLLPRADAFPDNLTSLYFDGVDLSAPIESFRDEVVDFGTHAHADSAKVSVASALSAPDLEALLAFLGVMSSHTELGCPNTLAVSSFASSLSDFDAQTNTATLGITWESDATASCEIRVFDASAGVDTTLVTAGSVAHSVDIEGLPACANFEVTIIPVNRVCGVFSPAYVATVPFWNPVSGATVINFSSALDPSCEWVELSWQTTECVPTTLEWGEKLKGVGYPYVVTTSPGIDHSVTLSVEPGMRYKGRITPTNGPTSDDVYADQGARAREPRAEARQRDSAEGVGVFRPGGARPPTEVMVAFIDAHRDEYGVEPICASCRSPRRPTTSTRPQQADPDARPGRSRDDELRVRDPRVWENEQVYGATQGLASAAREGFEVARCTVERLMREMGLRGVVRGRAWHDDADDPAPPGPRIWWCVSSRRPAESALGGGLHLRGDVGGFVYVAFVIDVFARRIVGWRVSTSLATDFVLDALEQAMLRVHRPWHVHDGQPDERAAARFRRDQHTVTLTRGFYMSKYEVTEQWWAR